MYLFKIICILKKAVAVIGIIANVFSRKNVDCDAK